MEFKRLSTVEKASYVLSENWEDSFDILLHLVKEFVIVVSTTEVKFNSSAFRTRHQ